MKTWSLTLKFSVILSISIIASITIATIGILKFTELNASMASIVKVDAKKALLAESINGNGADLINQESDLATVETREELHRTVTAIEGTVKDLDKDIASYLEIATDDEKKELSTIQQILSEWKVYDKDLKEYVASGKKREAYTLARGKVKELLEKIDKVIMPIVERSQEKMVQEEKHADEVAANARNVLILITLISVLASSFLSFAALKSINQSIDRVISNLDDNSNQVTSSAQQIASSSEELSHSTTEQAASLEETSASIEEMNSMVKRNSENANQAAEVSASTLKSATEGKQVVSEMLKAMTEINESNEQISQIVKVISEIENKTKVINDIVFKTQLLSFNASVEAARAGAHGKGFAVVAEEVGKLAQLSGNAALEISSMLATSVEKVNSLVTLSKEKVEIGTEVAEQCGVVLEEIVNHAGTLSKMAQDIASATSEQAQGIDEVSRAANQLDQITQQNSTTSEESASAAEELAEQAVALKNTVKTLIRTIKGGSEYRHESEYHSSYTNKTIRPPITTPQPKSFAKVLHIKSPKAPSFSRKKVAGDSDYSETNLDEIQENDPRFNDI